MIVIKDTQWWKLRTVTSKFYYPTIKPLSPLSLSDQVTYEEMAEALQQADVGIPSTDIVSLLHSEDFTGGGKISFTDFRAITLGNHPV